MHPLSVLFEVWPDDPTSSFGSMPDLLRDVSVIEGMDELSARTLEEFIAVSTRKLLVGNVTESARAVTFQISRCRKYVNFGCSHFGC